MKVEVAKSFFQSIKKLNGLGHVYREIRGWLYYHTRKEWYKILHELLHSYPYDNGYLLRLERVKLKEMIAYHERVKRFVGVEEVIRDMKLCVSLLDIMLEERSLFHFDGDIFFKKSENDNYEIGHTPDFKYVCDINVNLKNINRFEPRPDYQQGYLEYPHEFYILKARHLYHKLRAEYETQWWD